MCENKLLSIIVPVYKTEKYLDRCIQSMVNQTYKNLEIILVDDGSPDNCPQMCDEWAKKDDRIKVIHKQNGGLSDARNAGISCAKGDYLGFVDSDDYISHDMYELLIEATNNYNADIVCCGMYYVDQINKKAIYYLNEQKVFSNVEAIKELLIGECFTASACNKLFKKELYSDIKFPKGAIYEDFAIMPYLLGSCSKIVHIGTPMYYYCQNGVSITRSKYSEKKRIILNHLDKLEQFLKENFEELLPFYDVVNAQNCQSNLYLLLDNEEIYNTYYEDYKFFYERFKKSFKTYIKLGKLSTLEKIKAYLIYYKLYYIIHMLLKRLK